MKNNFYKRNPGDKIWWVDDIDTIGEELFSFDREKVYNLFKDYPHNMTAEEVRIFNAENPYWANFFADRRL